MADTLAYKMRFVCSNVINHGLSSLLSKFLRNLKNLELFNVKASCPRNSPFLAVQMAVLSSSLYLYIVQCLKYLEYITLIQLWPVRPPTRVGFVSVNQSSLFSCQDLPRSSTRSSPLRIVLVVLTQNYETIKKRMLL